MNGNYQNKHYIRKDKKKENNRKEVKKELKKNDEQTYRQSRQAKWNKVRIFIDKSGNWFQDGLKITHRWTYLENNKNLDVDKDGRFFLDEGFGKVYVEVEDTPFVVKMINKKDGSFYATLNDETTEYINLKNTWFGNDNVLYTKVKNNKYSARFLSPAYYELMKSLERDGDDFYIRANGLKIKIGSTV